MNLPHFFKDNSDSMKFEETIDFFISWTIRCADIKYESEPGAVHSNSKKILSYLIADEENYVEYPFFENIKVWKQSSHVDLWAEFEAGKDKKRFALIIENKMYSSIRPNQLQNYKEIANKYYEGDNSIDVKFVFLRPDYELETKDKELIDFEKLKYRYINLEELKAKLPKKKTNNQLFDEFWYKWYEV